MGLPNLSYWVPFAAYEFDGDKVDVVNGMASLVKAWWNWCSYAELVVIQDRTSVFSKAFIELTLGLSDVLKVTLWTFYQVYEVFWVARYGVSDFSTTPVTHLTPQAAQTLFVIYIRDSIALRFDPFIKRMYENGLKIALNSTCSKGFK